jgi:hypothetical protein
VPIPGSDNSTLVAAWPELQDTVDQGNVIAGKIAANSTVKTRDLNSFSKRQLKCGNGIVSLDPFIWLLATNRFCDTVFSSPRVVYWIPSGASFSTTLGLPGGFSITIKLSVSTPCNFPFYVPITQGTCNAYFANSVNAMSQDCFFDNGWQDTSPALQPPFYPLITDGSIS